MTDCDKIVRKEVIPVPVTMEHKKIFRMIRNLPSGDKTDRVISFIRMVASEPDDDVIYEDMDPIEEDALYQTLATVERVWEDE